MKKKLASGIIGLAAAFSLGYWSGGLEEAPPVEGPFIVSHAGYTACYDGRTHTPIWVYERLTPDSVKGPAERRERFREDPALPYSPTLADYRKSGYDRGHLAAAGNHHQSQEALDATFYLTNICPQVGAGFNRGAWRNLEQHVRGLLAGAAVVHVVSGPLFLPSGGQVTYPVIGPNDVAVPTHFFKIVIVETDGGKQERHAYLLANQPSDAPISTFEIPVEKAERLAGIKLHDSL